MILLAIDPGSTDSAYVLYNTETRDVCEHAKLPNEMMDSYIHGFVGYPNEMIVEYPAPRGQPMYTQLVDTIFWIGRFSKSWDKKWHRMDRKDVKMTLCRSTKANDSQIRAAIISRYPATGGGVMGQIGTKSNPGPLYGVSKDVWAALAIAITWSIQNKLEPDTIGLQF